MSQTMQLRSGTMTGEQYNLEKRPEDRPSDHEEDNKEPPFEDPSPPGTYSDLLEDAHDSGDHEGDAFLRQEEFKSKQVED